jgi:hypothetical protein
MCRNNRKIYRRLVCKFLLALIVILGSSIVGFSQIPESDESVIVVPEQTMEVVVRRILVWSFKPRKRPTVIYLAEQGIKQSWLPTIKNIEFRLLSNDEIQEKDSKVHFFTKPDLLKNTYDIGFAFGNPNCEYFGAEWHFRIVREKVRLWQGGGFGGSCGSSS